MSMKAWPAASTLLAVGAGALLSLSASPMTASEPEWAPSRVKECNRECLVGLIAARFRKSNSFTIAISTMLLGDGWTGSGR